MISEIDLIFIYFPCFSNSLLDRIGFCLVDGVGIPLFLLIQSGMQANERSREKEHAFWAKYADLVQSRGYCGKYAEWMVRRAQDFVYGLDGRRLREVDAVYLSEYLDALGRNAKVSTTVRWQAKIDWLAGGPPAVRQAKVAGSAGRMPAVRRSAVAGGKGVIGFATD